MNSKITIKKKDIVMRVCVACGTITAHIGKEDGTRNGLAFAGGIQKQPFSTCLQCFVDGNQVNEWSRWLDPITNKILTIARGY